MDDLHSKYIGIGIGVLTHQEELYVQRRCQGLEPLAAARAANFSQPKKAVFALMEREDINLAISYTRDMQRRLNIEKVEFTRDDATALYLEAHSTAENSTEKIRAVDSLVKLHGLAAAEKKEITVTSRKEMQVMDDAALMAMAGNTFSLAPEDYMEVTE